MAKMMIDTIPEDSDLWKVLHTELMRYIALGDGRHDPLPGHAAIGLRSVLVGFGALMTTAPEPTQPWHNKIDVQFELEDGRGGRFVYRLVPITANLELPDDLKYDFIEWLQSKRNG